VEDATEEVPTGEEEDQTRKSIFGRILNETWDTLCGDNESDCETTDTSDVVGIGVPIQPRHAWVRY